MIYVGRTGIVRYQPVQSARMNTFDPVAHDFDAFRALPDGIPVAIRKAVLSALAHAPSPWLLDLGAGTGRVGEAFVAAGDCYVGIDNSLAMLMRFATKLKRPGSIPCLVQADGRALPFDRATFDGVLLVHVVSNVSGWRRLIDEARRVLRDDGALLIGQIVRPPDGLDARMNASLDLIANELGMAPRRSKTQKHDARRELLESARSRTETVVATWDATRTARTFLARKPTGGRFSALDPEVRDEALRRLADWAVATLGSLDAPSIERFAFTLDTLRF